MIVTIAAFESLPVVFLLDLRIVSRSVASVAIIMTASELLVVIGGPLGN
jgi:hypothetical protein